MKYKYLYLCCLSGISAMELIYSSPIFAAQAPTTKAEVASSAEYDNTFLVGAAAENIDLSRYSNGNPTLPGIYKVNIYINEQLAGVVELDFVDVGTKSAVPCFTSKNIAQLGIKQPDDKSQLEQAVIKDKVSSDTSFSDSLEGRCLDLKKLVPAATVVFDNAALRMDLSIPQIALERRYHNYVSPSLWEDGINAAMLSYNVNAYHNTNDGNESDSSYFGLNAGINLGAWHFRARGNANWNSDSGTTDIQYQNRYVQRDIPAWRSQLQLGEAYTTGDAFDSVSIRGARLYSDDRMLPSELTGYAPVVRGVANSNAKVTIEQNGYKIYETTVAPGQFAIDDLSPSGYGSSLEVTVEESDGTKRKFSVPFSSVVQLLRPGMSRWDFSAGEIQQNNLQDKPNLVQGTWYYGLNNMFTGYTGIQATDNNYYSVLLGVGMNTDIGAFSFDVTRSSVEIPDDQKYQGQSYRLSYSKLLSETNTSLNIAAYRYSTENYLGLNDAMMLIDNVKHNMQDEDGNPYGLDNYSRLRNQVTLSVSQPLQFGDIDYGSFYTNFSWQDYWGGDEQRKNYSAGYSNGASWGSYSITLQRSYDEDDQADDSLYLSFSIPLEVIFGGEHKQSGFRSIESSFNSDFKGGNQLNVSSNGNSESGLFSYSVNTGYQQTHSDRSDTSSVGGYMSYESDFGTWSTSASASSDDSRQYSLNTNGGFVLHSGGLTFSNDSFNDTDTMVLVKAPGAKGARINYGNSTVDRWGYGVTSSMTPYRENRVSLDVSTLENDVELKSTSGTSVPRQGAITMINFETDEGRSALLYLSRNDQQPIPLGAEVFDSDNQMVGNVGQAGQAFIRGIQDSGKIKVVWGSNNDQTCYVRYQLPENPTMLGHTLVLTNQVCVVSSH
ncbi:MAG TPA: outer membrane usher protein [Scandinavium sp.]